MNLAKSLLGHFKPYWKNIIIAFLFSLIGGFFTILPPIFTGKLVDGVIHKSLDLLPWLITGILIAFLGKVIFESLQEYVQIKLGLDVITDMQLRVFKKLHKAPLSFFQRIAQVWRYWLKLRAACVRRLF